MINSQTQLKGIKFQQKNLLLSKTKSNFSCKSLVKEKENIQFKDGSGVTSSRIINGCWTLAGGHGRQVLDNASQILGECADAGFNTYDTADIYGKSQGILAKFKNDYESKNQKQNYIQIFSKFCPSFQGTITKEFVNDYVKKRILQDLKVQSIDLLQMHWWDFEQPGFVDAAKYLMDLKEEGLIKSIGLTNMNCAKVQELLDAGIKIGSNQIQFSVLDRRPLNGMMQLCKENDIKVLTYGSVAGGLLSGKFAISNEKQQNRVYGAIFGSKQINYDLNTISLKMYWRIVEQFGGKKQFANLMEVLSIVAARNDKSVAQVALRWVIQQGDKDQVIPIVGIRNSDHLKQNAEALEFELKQNDMDQIQEVLKQATGPKGDVYTIERGI